MKDSTVIIKYFLIDDYLNIYPEINYCFDEYKNTVVETAIGIQSSTFITDSLYEAITPWPKTNI